MSIVRACRPCAHPGCPEIVRGRGSLCPAHVQSIRGGYDRDRGSAAQRGYDARWRRLRAIKLAADPLCADPYGRHVGQVIVATDVDHIKPKRQGGTDAWDNLQSLCESCHSHKTVLEDGGLGREVQISTDFANETAPGLDFSVYEFGG